MSTKKGIKVLKQNPLTKEERVAKILATLNLTTKEEIERYTLLAESIVSKGMNHV